MSNYNEIIGETRYTDAGEYTIVALVHDDGCGDQSISLYVGRAADGHHDMIASDNASMWVVGDESDAERNRAQWEAISGRCDVAPVIDEVRKIDAELADWLTGRYEEARQLAAKISAARIIDETSNHQEDKTMKLTWQEIDEIATRHGARRVMQTGPLGKTGFSFNPDEIWWLDVDNMSVEDLDRELSTRSLT